MAQDNIAPDEDFCFANWDKLPGIVAKSWKTEKVEDFVAVAAQSRVELAAARSAPCTCGGQRADFACAILSQNGHAALNWRKAVTESLSTGRSKGNPVCHAGFEGNEGKSPLPCLWFSAGSDKQKVNLPSHVAKGCGSCFAMFQLRLDFQGNGVLPQKGLERCDASARVR